MEVVSRGDEEWAVCPEARCRAQRLSPDLVEQYRMQRPRFLAALARANGLTMLPDVRQSALPTGVEAIGVTEIDRVRVCLLWLAPPARTRSTDLILAVREAFGRAYDAIIGISAPQHAVEPARPDKVATAVLDAAQLIEPGSFALDRRRLSCAARGSVGGLDWFRDWDHFDLHFGVEDGFVVGRWGDVPLEAPDFNATEEACVIDLLYLAAARLRSSFGWVSKSGMDWNSNGTDQKRMRDFIGQLEGRRVGMQAGARIAAEHLLPTASVEPHGGDSIRLALPRERIHIGLGHGAIGLRTAGKATKSRDKSRRTTAMRRVERLRRLLEEITTGPGRSGGAGG